jgi:predicted metal-dependent peptidase
MLLGIDTSGSVSDDELREFMTEIHHIHKTGVDVTIIQCDTAIVSIKEYKGKYDGIKIGGRGGTSFDPVIDYFNANLKKYTSLVYFTDGEAWTDLKPKAPTLWVLSECSQMNESLPGRVIKLEL